MLTRHGWASEWLVVRRHPLVWIVALLAIAFIAFAASTEPTGDARELREALLRLNLFIPVFVLPFVAGALAPVFYLREVNHGLGEVFAAYPLSLRAWLGLRVSAFTGLLLTVCAAQQAAILGQFAAAQPGMLTALAGQSAKLMVLVHVPACVIWACALARVSCASGKAGMVYLAAAFGWLAYVALATLTGTPLIAGSFVASELLRAIMVVTDPYAISALVNPAPIDGVPFSNGIAIALGRAGWLGLCLLLLLRISAIPAPSAPGERPKQRTQARRGENRSAMPGRLAMLLGWTISDKFLLLAFAGWILLVFPEVFSGMDYAEQFAVLVPDSRDALNRVMWDLVPPAGALLLLYVADRVARIDAATGMAELSASTAYPSWRLLCAQLACVWSMALAFVVFTLLIVASAQLVAGSAIQVDEHLAQGAQSLSALLLSGGAFVSLHALVRSRMAANLACVALVIIGRSNLAPNLGLIHPLWKPFNPHLTVPDHILGIEGNWAPLLHYGLFWAALIGSALVLATLYHHRGLPYRQVGWLRGGTRPAMLIVVVLLSIAALQGRALDATLTYDFALVSADDRAQRRADYELRYGNWAGRPQPDIAEVTSRIDFGMDGRSADIRMTMQLINRTDAAIERILVGHNLADVTGKLALTDGDAETVDRALGQTVFRLSAPMHAGEVRTLHFSARIARSALSGENGLLILRPEFASLPLFQYAPVVGFQREITLLSPTSRAEFGLPMVVIAPPSSLGPPPARLAGHRASFTTQVSAPHGHHAIAPGELVRRWDAGERSHFLFRTEGEIRNLPTVFAMPWAPQHWQVGGSQAEIYAPAPVAEDDANVLAMRDTLTWLDREVAPYPGKTLRLIAAPEFGSGAYAIPQAVMMSHRRGFRAQPAPDAGFSQVYRRAVHEAAHQWFGHLIGYGIPEERAFLIESLAKYAELVMIERRYGREAMQALVAWEADRYARARLLPAQSSAPFIDAEDTEDQYSRATLVFSCLRTKVGDAAIIAALKSIAEAAEKTGQPVRSLDFVRVLRQTGGKANGPVVDALLARRLTFEQALAQSSCSRPA